MINKQILKKLILFISLFIYTRYLYHKVTTNLFISINKINIQHLIKMQSKQDSLSSNKYRTKEHQSIIRLKAAEQHLDMMKRRFKYLQVRDEGNRSKTIQHEMKLQAHSMYREEAKREEQIKNLQSMRRMQQIENQKQKNTAMKIEIEETIKTVREKKLMQNQEQVKDGKAQQQKNQHYIEKFKELHIKERVDRRKSVNQQEQSQKINVSRYRQNKRSDIMGNKSIDVSQNILKAEKKERELRRLSKIQEELLRKNAESMQVSQAMQSRMREVLGDQRRFTKLPEIRNKSSTRGSTGLTQIISI